MSGIIVEYGNELIPLNIQVGQCHEIQIQNGTEYRSSVIQDSAHYVCYQTSYEGSAAAVLLRVIKLRFPKVNRGLESLWTKCNKFT